MLSHERLLEVLNYDPNSGLFTWRRQLAPRGKLGTVAGNVSVTNGQSRRMIRLDGRLYLASRLAWFHVHGAWPTGDIDHRDCDPMNNRIENLRDCTHAQNMRNLRPRSRVGLKGVTFDKQRGKWVAQLRRPGSSSYIGRFDSPEAAHAAYREVAERELGEFARVA